MQNLKAESTNFPGKKSILIGDKLIDLSTPLVMGIINCTPDSFYTESRTITRDSALAQAEKMILEGADILDIGGYSSRPGANNISTEEETKRIIPAISAIRETFPDTLLSVDTFRADVANQALEHGAHIINDISGFSIDPEIVDVAARHKVPYILMHMRGTPQNMQKLTQYTNLFNELMSYFSKKLHLLQEKGVNDVIIDPGFGFSKTLEQNHDILGFMEHFQHLGHPLLLGVSRKSMIYKKLGISPEESLEGTIALNAIGLSKGASILRVHDVKEAKSLVKLLY